MRVVRLILRNTSLVLGAAIVCVAEPLHAQSSGGVRGNVKASTGFAISGAQLRVHSSAPTVETDERGYFALSRVTAGHQWLHARRIGFRPDSQLVTIEDGKTADASFVLQRVAIDLAPVTVMGRRDLSGPMAGFYQRQATQSGHFFSHAEIARRAPHRLTDLLRGVPGVRVDVRNGTSSVRVRGSRCAPQVRLDGQSLSSVEVDLDSFDPMSFDGIEVYSGGSTVPTEFATNRDVSGSCGTIVLWTRRGEPRDTQRKKGALSPAMQIAKMLDELRVYTAADVDIAAHQDSARVVHPLYPDALFESQTSGRVLTEFVVSEAGIIVMDTFSAITTTHPDFIEPVREALRQQRFTPAQRHGKSVQQVVQQLFEFIPDSTARRKRL